MNEAASADRHPSRLAGARGAAQGRGGDGARASCARLVCTASLDLGVDWGDVDLVIQMGAPKGSSRLTAADRPRQSPARRAERGDPRPRQPLRISGGARRARRGRRGRARPRGLPPRRARRARPAYHGRRLRRARSARRSCWTRCAPPRLMPGCPRSCSAPILSFIESGGYALKAYDRSGASPGARTAAGGSRIPRFIQQHRMNAGIIVDAPLYNVRFRNGRRLGTVEDNFAETLRAPATPSSSPAWCWRWSGSTAST